MALGWLSVFFSCSSHPLSSFPFYGSSVPAVNVVSDVASSTWGGGGGGGVWTVCFHNMFLSSSGARVSLVIVTSFGFYLVTDDTILSFCHKSHGPSPRSSIVGYSEKVQVSLSTQRLTCWYS